MADSLPARSPGRLESRLALALFLACLAFHVWGASVGWESRNLPGVEFRQTQTALSAHFIQVEGDFSLDYPTPVLGKPWSIPMEFPLYQWTVVALSNLTGLELVKAGRLVGVGCFYLSLPALFLLLADWRVARGRRWLVLSVVVTCPLYIFYGRAFLIETMALMFSVWFWVAFKRAVEGRSRGWLVAAMAAGAGAGLVKVTTFMLFLLPAAGWALVFLWRNRTAGRWRADLAWMTAGVALPALATLGWLNFADAVKARNPAASFLVSDKLTDFNFGTNATRFSGELWALKGRIIAQDLTWLPLLVGCALLAAVFARPRWREIALCVVMFAAPLVIFPVLYALHEYYFVANTVLLMVAMGMIPVALSESARSRWLVVLTMIVLTGGQIYGYLSRHYPSQSNISHGGDGLSASLNGLTEPDDVLVIVGQDWNSMTPYYARRRALMLREDAERDEARIEAALKNLDGERIGAFVVSGSLHARSQLIQRIGRLGLETKPLYFWRETAVFLREDRRDASIEVLEDKEFHEVRLAEGVETSRENLAAAWFNVAELRLSQRHLFNGMSPRPVRFYSTFGPTLNQFEGRADFGAHPVTRLVFALAAGRHHLRTTLAFPAEAYRSDLPMDKTTDGVEVSLFRVGPGESRELLVSRLIDPRAREDHRGLMPLQFDFELAVAGEVELFVGPGPAGLDTRDWVTLGRLIID